LANVNDRIEGSASCRGDDGNVDAARDLAWRSTLGVTIAPDVDRAVEIGTRSTLA
jgi:hypothetical protein